MSRQDTIGKTATVIYTDNNGMTCVKYHDTDVVKFNNDKIILNSGGWKTNTTKLRMNQASRQFRLDFQVYQTDFNWYIVITDLKTMEQSIIEFFDGIELTR